MNYTLPKKAEFDGREYEIRYDFRVILDIIQMLNDPDLNNAEKAEAMLRMFYKTPEEITNLEEAIKFFFYFINCGDDNSNGNKVRLMDWDQDFNLIVSPVNRVLGQDVRGVEELHWWTFMSSYMEIGPDCLFSQIVSIRDKILRGKKLEKAEKEWAHRNSSIVNIKQKYSDAENDLIKKWTE